MIQKKKNCSLLSETDVIHSQNLRAKRRTRPRQRKTTLCKGLEARYQISLIIQVPATCRFIDSTWEQNKNNNNKKKMEKNIIISTYPVSCRLKPFSKVTRVQSQSVCNDSFTPCRPVCYSSSLDFMNTTMPLLNMPLACPCLLSLSQRDNYHALFLTSVECWINCHHLRRFHSDFNQKTDSLQ